MEDAMDPAFVQGTCDRLAELESWSTRQTDLVSNELRQFKNALMELDARVSALETRVQAVTDRDMPDLRGRTVELRCAFEFIQSTMIHVMQCAAAVRHLFTDEARDNGTLRWAAPSVMTPRTDSGPGGSMGNGVCGEQ